MCRPPYNYKKRKERVQRKVKLIRCISASSKTFIRVHFRVLSHIRPRASRYDSWATSRVTTSLRKWLQFQCHSKSSSQQVRLAFVEHWPARDPEFSAVSEGGCRGNEGAGQVVFAVLPDVDSRGANVQRLSPSLHNQNQEKGNADCDTGTLECNKV